MSKLPLRAKEAHGKPPNLTLMAKKKLQLQLQGFDNSGTAQRQQISVERMEKEGEKPIRCSIGENPKASPQYFLDPSIKSMAAIRRSPKHINIQRLIDLVQSKQSRNVENLTVKKRTRVDDSVPKCPVKLQINSFMAQKEEVHNARPVHNYQDTSTDSTASNTIPSAHLPHGAVRVAWANGKAKLPPEKKPDPEVLVVHLSKSPLKSGLTACIKRSGNGNKLPEKLAKALYKYSKTPERSRGTAHRTSGTEEVVESGGNPGGNNKRNKTPIRLALMQAGIGPPKRHNSKKDGLHAISGSSQLRSRNQRPLGESNNDLVVRTKPEDSNVPLLAAQQMLSTRKEFCYAERRNSGIKQPPHVLHSRSHYKAFYPNGKQGPAKLVIRQGDLSQERRTSPKDLRLAILSAFQEGESKHNRQMAKKEESLADTSAPVISRQNIAGEPEMAGDDSDECKTVIENNCDNDYSLICNSLNGVY